MAGGGDDATATGSGSYAAQLRRRSTRTNKRKHVTRAPPARRTGATLAWSRCLLTDLAPEHAARLARSHLIALTVTCPLPAPASRVRSACRSARETLCLPCASPSAQCGRSALLCPAAPSSGSTYSTTTVQPQYDHSTTTAQPQCQWEYSSKLSFCVHSSSSSSPMSSTALANVEIATLHG